MGEVDKLARIPHQSCGVGLMELLGQRSNYMAGSILVHYYTRVPWQDQESGA